MKKSILVVFVLLFSFKVFSQIEGKTKEFLSHFATEYKVKELNFDFQYYRQLTKLRTFAHWTKEIELKSTKTHSSKYSYNLSRKQRIQFYAFEYYGVKECYLAYQNLLKCFPNDCLKIEEWQNLSQKITPSVFVINELDIICAGIACEDVNEKWKEVIKEVVEKFADNDSKIIITKCGKLTWTSKSEIKEIIEKFY